MLDIAAFCRRIEYRGPTTPTLATLRELHRACLLHIPFENFDIHLGRRIVLDESAWFEKIVGRQRGRH